MLTKKQPNLRNIVVFGSTCTVHLHTDNKSLGLRGKEDIIIGKNDEMKGHCVFPAEGTRSCDKPSCQKH